MQDRLVDTPADVHVMDKLSWIRLGSHPLKPTTVKLRGASGADLHALGKCQVRGTSGKQPMALEVIFSEGARTCLLSGTQLRRQACTVSISQLLSWIGKGSSRANLQRIAGRDVLVLRVPSVELAHEVTVKLSQTRSAEAPYRDSRVAIGAAGRVTLPLERRGHSSYDGRWEIRVRCRDVVRHPVSVGKHTVRIDDGHVKRREFEHGSVSRAKRRTVRTRCRQVGCTTAEGSRRIPHHLA